ncbi:MAG: hypothetical protein AAFO07_05035 [Bacteroidota bacterium]
MNKQEFKTEVRKLIGEAETEQALDLMLEFFGKNSAYLNLYNQTLQAKALFNRTENDENQGVIAPDDAKISYNQVNKQMITVLNLLDKEDDINQPKRRTALYAFIAIAVMLVVALGLVVVRALGDSGENINSQIPDGEACPEYSSQDAFNVLVLPFRPRKGDTLTVERDVIDRLALFSSQQKLELGLGFKVIDNFDDGTYPVNHTDAEEIAKDCDAKLIIWGSTEQSEDGDIIFTQYKFVDVEHFSVNQLVLTASATIDTISSQTSIVTNGLLTEDIEVTLQYLLGIIAHELGNEQAVIEALNGIALKDSMAMHTRNLFLGEAYISESKNEEAIAIFTEALDIDPTDSIARQNRASLNFLSGQYTLAEQDLSIQAEQTPENSKVQIGHAITLYNSGHLEEGLEKIKPYAEKTQDTSLMQMSKEIALQVENKNRTKDLISKPSTANPNRTQKKSGDPVPAKPGRSEIVDEDVIRERQLKKLIAKDSTNIKAWSELLTVLRIQGKQEEIFKTVDKIEKVKELDKKQLKEIPIFQYVWRKRAAM